MGNPADPISQANALHAAELAVAVEQQRLTAARGEAVDIDALVRLCGEAAGHPGYAGKGGADA